MEKDKLGLREILAMGLGGTIGGGIFAALGVAIGIAGDVAYLSYFIAGIIALLSAYSYTKLTLHLNKGGGTFTFIEYFYKNNFATGISAAMLLIAYIGTMAMYAFAFGSFAVDVLTQSTGITLSFWGRPLLSSVVVLIFLWVNLKGAHTSGSTEDVLVYFKISVLALFGIVGLIAILGSANYTLKGFANFETAINTGEFGIFTFIVAIAAIFVSFEGFELLSYEYSEIENPRVNLAKGVYGTVIIATVVYIFVTIVTSSLVTLTEINKYKETILGFAAQKLFPNTLVDEIAFILIVIAALFSTASAINATLFSTSRLADKIAEQKFLPKFFNQRTDKNVPKNALIVISAITIILTILGTLDQVVSFASVSFILIFGVANVILFHQKQIPQKRIIPLLGSILTGITLILFFVYLGRHQVATLIFIVITFLIIILIEYVYIKTRDPLHFKNREILSPAGSS